MKCSIEVKTVLGIYLVSHIHGSVLMHGDDFVSIIRGGGSIRFQSFGLFGNGMCLLFCVLTTSLAEIFYAGFHFLRLFNDWISDTHLLTYLLTPWSRVLLEKLTSKLCR